ncbi:hypothetical protein FACS189431_1290 [Alphaproteobacteria bacterium]|nr:hypothetical protein FACS189431_1290 [Alphaproteobacteria bacterium]
MEITLLSVAATTAAILAILAFVLSWIPALRDNVVIRRIAYVALAVLGIWGGLVAGLGFPWWTIFVLLGFLFVFLLGWFARKWYERRNLAAGGPINVNSV